MKYGNLYYLPKVDVCLSSLSSDPCVCERCRTNYTYKICWYVVREVTRTCVFQLKLPSMIGEKGCHCTWHGNYENKLKYMLFFFHGWFIPSGELTYPLPTGIFESKILLCPFGGIWILSLEKPRPKTRGITSLLKPMPLGDNTDPASSHWLGQGMTTQ